MRSCCGGCGLISQDQLEVRPESRSPQVCLDDTLFWAVTDRLRLMCERKPIRFQATRDDMILVFVPKLEDAVVGIL
jgi:hypothetical protein